MLFSEELFAAGLQIKLKGLAHEDCRGSEQVMTVVMCGHVNAGTEMGGHLGRDTLKLCMQHIVVPFMKL